MGPRLFPRRGVVLGCAAEDDVGHRNYLSGATLFCSVIAIAGCGAAPKQAGGEDNFDVTPTGTAAPAPAPAPRANKAGSDEKDDALTPDQRAQMEIALRRGGEKAAQCINVAADAKPGEGEVKVLFDGKIGKATDATVGPPWAGSPLVESCIKRSFIGEFVVPFDGKLEVPYTVKLVKKEDPGAAKDAKKDPKKK